MRKIVISSLFGLLSVAALAQSPAGGADYCATLAQGGDQNAILKTTCENLQKSEHDAPSFSFDQSTQRAQETALASAGTGVGLATSAVQELIMAKASYSAGNETYHDFTINAKLSSEDQVSSTGLYWTFAQLQHLVQTLFDPQSPAQFKFSKAGNVKGKAVSMFTFTIPRASNKGWFFSVDGKEFYPGVKGDLWVDEKTGSVAHVKAQTQEIEKDKQVPIRTVTVAADFDAGQLGADNLLPLPTKADVQYCRKDQSACLNNSISFKNYQKLGSATSQ